MAWSSPEVMAWFSPKIDSCCCMFVPLVPCRQVDVTSKTEGKVDNSHMLVKYDARLRDNVAVNVVQEVTDTVQVRVGMWVSCKGWGAAGWHLCVYGLGAYWHPVCVALMCVSPMWLPVSMPVCILNACVCCRLRRQASTWQPDQSLQALAR